MLARRHLFEFNDESWAPEALRALIVESLGRTLGGAECFGVLLTLFSRLRESIKLPVYST